MSGNHTVSVIRVPGEDLKGASVTAVAQDSDVVVSAVGSGHGDVAGHLATAEPAVRSLVAGVRDSIADPALTVKPRP